MDLFDVINKFQLGVLGTDWYEKIWKEDFSCDKDKDLPSEYIFALEDEDYGELLNSLSESIREWLASDSTLNGSVLDETNQLDGSSRVDKKSWQTIIASDVNHRALLAVVSTFLKSDIKELTDDVTRRHALAASRCYFMFLAIRGAPIYKIFNSILFGQAVESLKVLNLLNDVQDKPKSKSKGRKKKNADEEVEEDQPELDDIDAIHISIAERQQIIKYLIVILDDLEFCFRTLSLKSEDDSLSSTISALVSIVRLEKTTATFVQRTPVGNNVTYLAFKAYKTMMSMCHENHGRVSEIVRSICCGLLHYLVISAQEVHTNDKSKNVIRSHMISFIRDLVDKLGSAAFNGVTALVQQLCIRTPDKADIRARCVQQILTLLSFFPFELFTKCTMWIISLSHNDTVRNRVVGIEILTKLLNSDERTAEESENGVAGSRASTSYTNGFAEPSSSRIRSPTQPPPESDNSESETDMGAESAPAPQNEPGLLINGEATSLYVSHKFFLSAILSRTLDQSPTVRAKCLASIAPLILIRSQVMQDIMKSTFVQPYAHFSGPLDGIIEDEKCHFDFRKFFNRKIIAPPKNPLPGGTRIVDRIQTLTKDQKVYVRKSALQVLSNVCRLNSKWISPERVNIMVLSCLDFSVIVRKTMIQCLTDLLLEFPNNDSLIKAWVQGIMPLVADNEVKCQEKAFEAVTTVILDNLVAHEQISNNLHFIPWKTIDLLSKFEMRNLFKVICRHWVITKRIGTKEMKILKSHISTENDIGAWFFIVCLSAFTDFHQPDMIVDYYLDNIYDKPTVQEYCSQLVLEALFLNWKQVNPEIMNDVLQSKLLVSLENCTLPITSVTPIMDICTQQDETGFPDVAKRIITRCENYLVRYISSTSTDNSKEDSLTQHIFTMGEAASICPGHVGEHSVQILSHFIDSSFSNGEKPITWEGNVGGYCKAVTIITLGKFCLQDQMLAKRFVPLLGTQLEAATPTPIKLNALNTMADLCVRFTSLVESYLGDMCVCLKDPDVKVRKRTLDLMIRLIQEDYVKLKCPYFYYMLHMFLDSELHIRSTTKCFLINTVLTKFPRIMVQEFLQALYFFNEYEVNETMGLGYTKKANGSNDTTNPIEKAAFLMSGDGNKTQRRILLTFMVEHMKDDHKFKTLSNICNEIFDSVTEDKIVLDYKGTALVSDAIFILGCDELRLTTTKKGDENEEEENQYESDRFIALAVDVLLKKLFVENIMPSIIKFKRKLQELKSTLVRDLMISLRSMMKEFKDWMQEVMVGDPTLAAEIEFDMRILDEGEEEENSEPFSDVVEGPADMREVESQLSVQPVVSMGARMSPTSLLENMSNLTQRPSLAMNHASPREIVATPPLPAGSLMSDDDVSSMSTPSHCSQSSAKGDSKRRSKSTPSAVSTSPEASPSPSHRFEGSHGLSNKNCPSNQMETSPFRDSGSDDYSSPPTPVAVKKSKKQPTATKSDSNVRTKKRAVRKRVKGT